MKFTGGNLMQRLWLVRLGKNGEDESHALATNELVLGFTFGDLSGAQSREAMLELLLSRAEPTDSPKRLANFAAQLNQYCNQIKPGDIIVVPLKTQRQIAIGEAVGEFYMSGNGRPARMVKWLRPDTPRDIFHQDLRHSFGAFMTVCQVQRNAALARTIAVANFKPDPGYGVALAGKTATTTVAGDDIFDDDAATDLFELARDQIEQQVSSVFAGHDFTELIAAILRVQGFDAHVSPPGPDSGIDIVAGRGALGLEEPRIVVQVKSGAMVVDAPTLQSLIGCIADTHATQGLLVSWSGFKPTVHKRVNELYFRVRLWGRTQIVDALLASYPQLPEEIRARLPLQQMWTLVPDDGSVA